MAEKKILKKEYRTGYFFADMSDTDKAVYDIVQDFMRNTPAFKNKELWAKYCVFLYLSGARRIEPFMMNSTITKIEEDGHIYYRIKKVNAKHFTGSRLKPEVDAETGKVKKSKAVLSNIYNPKRKIMENRFVAWNKYEKALFEFLLNGNLMVSLNFKPLLPSYGKRAKKIDESFNSLSYNGESKAIRQYGSQISDRFSKLFKADVVNQETMKVEHMGIVPHMLRHVRAYDLLVNKELRESMVQRLIGWESEMVYYYADIESSMGEKQETEIYHSMGA